ncbi:MAG: Ig-like domain repeat protein [Bryobacteraceae bacterium]
MHRGIPSLVLAVAVLASAQPNTISTYAGGGPVNGPALSVNLDSAQGIAATANGDVYLASSTLHAVYKLSGDFVILIAGIPGIGGYRGDDGRATSASLNSPSSVAVDGTRNVYIADSGNNRIRKVSADTGVITTVAGDGSSGYGGDGGPATSASLSYLSSVAVDGSGNIYIADTSNNRIRKVSADTGVITTVAGNGSYGDSGDGGPATSASLIYPRGVAVDGSGNIYIAVNALCTRGGCSGSNRIRKVSADTGVITTVAGNGTYGFNGDGGPATSASLSYVYGVAVDGSGNIYIADTGNSRIRKVSAGTGVITTVAGKGSYEYSGDGGPATSASLSYLSGVAVDGSGNIYIADTGNGRIRKVSADTGVIITVAGNGSYGDSGDGGDGGPATIASLTDPSSVAVDGSGNIYIADTGNGRIRKVSADTGVIITVAGNGSYGYSGDGGPATSASLIYPRGVAVDGSGNIYIADTENHRIRKVSAGTGVIITVAGNGSYDYSGEDGPATSASLNYPKGVAVDGSGNIYIADTGNSRICKVSATTGVIITVAGNGSSGYSGDGGPATSASLFNPRSVAVDGSGNIYIAEYDGQRIRRIPAHTGVITTVAGDGSYGFSGDNGPATAAWLASPSGVAVDSSGVFYIADTGNRRVRKIDGRISTITLLTANTDPTETQNLVLTAAITPGDATGSVEFFDDTTALGSVGLSSGTATFSDLSLTAGTHSLVAYYSGDTNYAMSTSAAILQVVSSQEIGTITLTSDGKPTQSDGQTVYVSTLNSPATFTVTLTPAEASGTVQFFDGPMSLGVQPVSGGTAAFTTSSLPAGNHRITAVYSGDGSFMSRWAVLLTQQVQQTVSGNNVNTSFSSH